VYFRPRVWDDVVGQNHLKGVIQQSLFSGNFPKFSLFTGPSGTGKSSLAELCAMALTCSNNLTEPCGVCENCLKFIDGHSLSIKKYNMAKMLSKRDIVDVLDDIFQFESITGLTVYILEEVHALRDCDQSPFLEELTRIPDDVYIIMCTTQPYKVLSEIRNRAITFNCELPSNVQCRNFIKKICKSAGVTGIDDNTVQTLVEVCENTPRKIIATLQLFATGGLLNSHNLSEFFGLADKSIYIELLDRLQSKYSFYEYVTYLEDVTDNTDMSAVKIVKGLDSFMTDVLLERSRKNKFKLLENGEKLNDICNSLGEAGILRLMNALVKRDFHSIKNEASAKFFLISLKLELQGTKSSNASSAVITKIEANEKAHQFNNLKAVQYNSKELSKVDSSRLNQTATVFFDDDNEDDNSVESVLDEE
jgi:DNA polymerase-3 subunit gamma/tau